MADIVGTPGDDLLYGTDGDDTIYGLEGDDGLYGGSGTDVLHGGAGNDVLYAGTGLNYIYGDEGDDLLLIKYIGSVLSGGTWDGGAGFDSLSLDFYFTSLFYGDNVYIDLTNMWTGGSGSIGNIAVRNFEAIAGSVVHGRYNRDNVIIIGAGYEQGLTIRGSYGNDTITGGSGDDVISGGGGGNDILNGGNGNDELLLAYSVTVDGGAGFDFVRYHDNQLPTLKRLANGDVRSISSGNPSILYNVERLAFNVFDTNLHDYVRSYINLQGFATFDINNDHNSDIVFFSQSSGLVTATTVLGGVLVSNVTVATPGSANWDAQVVADLNGDGQAEIILKNAVTGAFQITSDSGPAINLGVIGTNWDVVASGDFNADFTSDILWRDSSNGHLSVWTFNYEAAQSSVADLGVLGTDWKAAGVGDFDNDGDADVLLRNDVTGQVYLYYMQDGAKSGSAPVNVFGTDWTVDGVGDFNNDNIADIALKNATTGQFYLLLMDNAGSYTGSNLGIIGTDWSIAATGDYTGDGTDDLLWRNANTNQIYMWAMQDGHQAATGSAPYGYLTADQIIV
jgi:RTX calcium-binding nonapeptide repeat (4 copies)